MGKLNDMDSLLVLRDWIVEANCGKRRWHLVREMTAHEYVLAIDYMDILEANFGQGFWSKHD